MQPSQKNRNVRYDRILALLVVLVLLLIVLVRCCTSCSSSDTTTETVESSVEATDTTEEATESAESLYAGVIYLSPSLQEDNTFATGDTNEAAVCRIIAEKTATLLEGAGQTVIVADATETTAERAAMGNYALSAYVGIQTNQGTGSGTSCYYNAASAQSQALAQAVYNEVATLTERDDNGLIDGTTDDNYYAEIATNNSVCCIIEVEYHDTTTIAQWLLDNEDAIADAIATGICSYLGVPYTGSTNSDSSAAAEESSVEETSNAIQDQLSE